MRGTEMEANQNEAEIAAESEQVLKSKKLSWGKLRRVDSFHVEAGRVSNAHHHASQVGWKTTLHLAFQSIGVVYGDIGTSPLYVYASTFTDGIKDTDDLLGTLSLIMYTILLLPLLKYVFIVLWANDNGDGGTFALYSLISRYARVSMIPNQQAEDAMVSNYKLDTATKQLKRAQWVKEKLENSAMAKQFLFFITILGTSMVIGDGVLTPCISVLSAVSGIKEKATSLSTGAIDGIAVAILIALFLAQRFGTDKVGYSFAPIISLWFAFIGLIGAYNLIKYDIRILRAFNPKYIVDYFRRNGQQGWISLGGIILCITGTEAMFADLGHFNIRAIQIGFSVILLPSVSLAYMGQAAYLTKFPENVSDTFYKSIPGPLFWPMFIIAVSAAIIASQAMISGAFAIISQSQSLGCFPRVKVVHTSAKYEGQVYIPEINYTLMILCVIVTLIFKTTEKIGNAYGIAVVAVMVITTMMVTLIMLVIWKTNIWWIALFFCVFGGIEIIYLSSVLYKFKQGGYLPLAFAAFLMIIMGVWHYAHAERYNYELKNKVSSSYIKDLAENQDIKRLPGIGLLYSELVQGIPPIFPHLIEKMPSIHSVLVIVSIKYLPISKVEMEERFLFRQIEPKHYRVYRCVVRYGYKDALEEPKDFERSLVENLKHFIQQETFFLENAGHANTSGDHNAEVKPRKSGASAVYVEETLTQGQGNHSQGSSDRILTEAQQAVQLAEDEMQYVQKEMENGVVYLLGEAEVVAHQDSSLIKKVVVNYLYNFMRRNFRQGEKVMLIPRSKLLRVGMTYEI
ncbi:potassium transporter 5-like [Dioscorea cayenensis subsp. rotundata]|uniref:Potassium transporter n=1 Tax=Dioscorea cayennensis subsp. rotundata TaxID=55577 RepID=A0AB40B9Y2_DIOCR|nr:potassium transporter 5-like [Dioscorea cayenensis subsp. rotundata]